MAGKPTYEELERKVKELEKEAVQHKEEKDALRLFSHSVESSIDGIAVGNAENRITYVNETFARMFGYSREELVGKEITFIYSEDQIPKLEEALKTTMEGGWTGELIGKKKDGELLPISVSSSRVVDDKGNVIAQMASHRDITERKQAECALRDSEYKYKTLTESSLIGVFVLQEEKYVFVNDRFAQIHGYTTQELLGKEYLSLIHPDHRELVRQTKLKRLKGEPAPKRYEVKRLRKDGKSIWCETIAVRIEYKGKPAIMGNIVDINEHKQAEEALKEKEEELNIKTNSLEEVNTVLRVLLKRRDEDKRELEENVLSNVKELVVPFLEKVKNSQLNLKQLSNINIVESNLNEIISPFLRNLSSKWLNLTPTEIRVAHLIKEGKTTKEIGEMMALSPRTIETHRKNMRKKLGIVKKKGNLRSHLLTLQ